MICRAGKLMQVDMPLISDILRRLKQLVLT